MRSRHHGVVALLLCAGLALIPWRARAEQFVQGSLAQNVKNATKLILPDYDPQVLSPDDIALYTRIFEVQKSGDWKTADRLINQLSDNVLMGYVLYQRYMHPTAYRSKYAELKNWMAHYADLPMASKICRLALHRKPAKARAPHKPRLKKYRARKAGIKKPHFEKQRRSRVQRRRVQRINRYVKSLLARERPTQVLHYINRKDVRRDLSNLEYDQILRWIAAQYFFERVPKKALVQAQKVIERHREAIPLADWTAGLAAWQLGEHDRAALHFEALAHAPYVSRSVRAAGAYWAARAFLVTRQPQKVTPLLEIAAAAPLNFYGVLANRQLGVTGAYDWKMPTLSRTMGAALLKNASVRRAVALSQIDHAYQAEEEIRRVHAHLDPSQDRALLALSARLNLPAAQLQIAEYATTKGLEAGLYPIPSFEPASGFQIDRALLYAFMRKESKFLPHAKSRVGARGLMQLMPRTASFLAHDRSLRRGSDKLFEPGFNLDLGQKYLGQLMSSTKPKGNLFMLTVAYNGGPGNLRKWRNELTTNTDPLFFIESIPSAETRNFIEGVLTNLWIYRHRLGQKSPTLEAAASGKWPIYKAIESKDGRVAIR